MSKAFRKGIAHETKRRSDKKLGRVFVDLGGRKDVASVGGEHYPMIVKDDFTRCAWMYFLRSCLLYTSPSPRDQRGSRMPSSA